MSNPDAGYKFDRYRRLLAEANDDRKRLALINLLIEEKAKDRLAEQALRARLSVLGISAQSSVPNAVPMEEIPNGKSL